jgi:hypothetical protein
MVDNFNKSASTLSSDQRRTMFLVGRQFGEDLKKFGDAEQSNIIAAQIAISNVASTQSHDSFGEALTQGMWHGFNFHLPMSIVLNRTGDYQS